MTAQSGIREGVASEVGAALEVVGHPRNHLLVLAERVNDKLGIKSLLDDAAFVRRRRSQRSSPPRTIPLRWLDKLR